MTDINTLLLFLISTVIAFGTVTLWEIQKDVRKIRSDLKPKKSYKHNYLRGSVDYKGRSK